MIGAKEISAFVEANRDECIKCLTTILQVPSVTGDEEPISFVFQKLMEDNGLKVTRHEMEPHHPNLLAEWFGSKPGKRFIFNGHMDVFPPDPKDPGTYGPWSGKVANGHIYGRGASDMKGGDAGAMMAVFLLKRMGFDPKGSVLLSWMCDEENGGRLGVQYMLKEGLLTGDFGLCMEPCDGRLIPQHGGILRGWVKYTAEAQHTAVLYEFGENALQKAIRAVGKLNELNAELIKNPSVHGLPPPHLTISVLNSGKAPNVQPSEATFWFDRRLVPGEDHEEALAQIKAVLDDLKAADPAYDYEMQVTSMRPLLDVPFDDPFVKLVAEAYREVMGKDVVIAAKPGGSDASWIRKVTGIAMPNFGAANGYGEMGKPDEKIPVERYLDFIKVYMMVLVKALS